MNETLHPLHFEPVLRAALAEDIGAGDITTLVTVPEFRAARAELIAKAEGIVAGLPIAERAFQIVEPQAVWTAYVKDGERVRPGEVLAAITGPARGLLTAERVALNFVQQLSGIATLTMRFVMLIAGTNARITDTRKTTPGLRTLEKYAVRCGGGNNHRFGLADAVLIKDNHLSAGGGVGATVWRAKELAPHTMRIEVECKTLVQVDEAIVAAPDIILLDNMDNATLREAVKRIGGQAITEASGGVNLKTVADIAKTGVDLISVGALTHSAPALDISLDFVAEG